VTAVCKGTLGGLSRATLLLPLLVCGCNLIFPFEVDAPLPVDISPPLVDTSVPLVEFGTDASTRDAVADGGGWRLVELLDPAKDGCPAPWTFFSTPVGCGVHSPPACGENFSSRSFDPGGTYQEVRGFVQGVQYKSTDAFAPPGTHQDIDQAYVDGVSITVGSPRRHVWTFASGLFAKKTGGNSCPCHGGSSPPAFVGQAWTCDSGNFDASYSSKWYTAEPLWDADSQGPGCKSPPQPGWFEVKLASPTTDAIEVRILFEGCDENVAITALELWVR